MHKVQALCCDTRASNTGRLNGACFLLEQLMERDLLYLPCQHHIFQLVLRSEFDLKLSLATFGTDVLILKKFQETWLKIDATKSDFGVLDTSLKAAYQHLKEEAVPICVKSLNKNVGNTTGS